MTTEDFSRSILRPSFLETGFAWFLRMVALFCLIFGIFYWIRLIGLYDGLSWRFDLMPIHWKIAASSLAVLFPFAAIGLWLMASWGPVLWFTCAATETVMYVLRGDLFAYRPTIAITHGVIAAIYILFRIAIHFQKRAEGMRG